MSGVSTRNAFPTLAEDEDAEEIATTTRRFNWLDITSGLPDDSRESDEKVADGQVRVLCARVKHARAIVTTTPGLSEILQSDWRRAARFFARIGVTEAMFRTGVTSIPEQNSEIRLPSMVDRVASAETER